MDSYENLKTRAAEIRDEVQEQQNTALRVGSLFWDIIDYIKRVEEEHGGEGDTLNEPLLSINNTFSGNPLNNNTCIVWNGSSWIYKIVEGGGSSSGITLQDVWNSLSSSGSEQIHSSHLVDALSGLFNSYSWWGNSFASGSHSLTGSLSGGIDYIEFSNGVRIRAIDTNTIRVEHSNGSAHFYATGGVSALGNSSGGGGGGGADLNELLTALNETPMPTSEGYLHWDSSNGFAFLPVSGGGGEPVDFGQPLSSIKVLGNPSSYNQYLVYRNGGWSYEPIITASSLVNDLTNLGFVTQSSLVSYLTTNQYLTKTQGDTYYAPYVEEGYLTPSTGDSRYVKWDFFNKLFRAETSNGTALTINDLTTAISRIKAMYTFYSTGGISSFGLSEGGGGGGVTLNDPLDTINNTFSSNPTSAQSGYGIVWNGSSWIYKDLGDIDLNDYVTRDEFDGLSNYVNTLEQSLESQIDLCATKTALNTTNSNLAALTGRVSTVEGYFLQDGVAREAHVANRLTNGTYSVWGQNYLVSGEPQNVTGNLTITRPSKILFADSNSTYGMLELGILNNRTIFKVGEDAFDAIDTHLYGSSIFLNGCVDGEDIIFKLGENEGSVEARLNPGRFNLGGFIINVDEQGNLCFNGNIYATGGVSALGYSPLVGKEPLAGIGELGSPTDTGSILLWDGNNWRYGKNYVISAPENLYIQLNSYLWAREDALFGSNLTVSGNVYIDLEIGGITGTYKLDKQKAIELEILVPDSADGRIVPIIE